MSRLNNSIPRDYEPPSFPSLYWPYRPLEQPAAYLYRTNDVWRFTLFWTLIVYVAFHFAASGYATAIQRKNWKLMLLVAIVYLVVSGVEALLAGSVVGLILGAVYNSGHFRMSTWIPFLWAVINVLVLIVSSFSIQGGL